MAEKRTQGNQSVDKAFQIIEVMSLHQVPMRLQDIARECGMSASTALRMLAALQARGYVRQQEGNYRYFFTLKFCQLTGRISVQEVLHDTVHPHIQELANRTGESIAVGIEHEYHLVYVDEVRPAGSNAISFRETRGSIAHLHANSIGKLLMSEFSENQINAVIAQEGLPRMTFYTITDRDTLSQELAKIRDSGVAIDHEECELGMRTIAVPVRGANGKLVCGLSLISIGHDVSDEYLMSKLPLMQETAEELKSLYFSYNFDLNQIL